ncbi:hypothetical protein OEZ86_007447 [Tetradesmus obliquus]|nr:hypothetical protein OEZ86_007447 [Tetradesmus obliquus]
MVTANSSCGLVVSLALLVCASLPPAAAAETGRHAVGSCDVARQQHYLHCKSFVRGTVTCTKRFTTGLTPKKQGLRSSRNATRRGVQLEQHRGHRWQCIHQPCTGPEGLCSMRGLCSDCCCRGCCEYKQQSWDKLSLSEQDFSFCRMEPRLPAEEDFSMAYDGNSLDTMAKVKQQIMLNGGVLTSKAFGPTDSFKRYDGKAAGAVYDPSDITDGTEPELHALFCYGWSDSVGQLGEGSWLCKNSWGASWGINGNQPARGLLGCAVRQRAETIHRPHCCQMQHGSVALAHQAAAAALPQAAQLALLLWVQSTQHAWMVFGAHPAAAAS